MAKLSSVNKNNKRIKLSDKFLSKRKKLKKIIVDDEYKKSILHASEVAIAQLNCKENPSSLAAKEVIHMLKNGK